MHRAGVLAWLPLCVQSDLGPDGRAGGVNPRGILPERRQCLFPVPPPSAIFLGDFEVPCHSESEAKSGYITSRSHPFPTSHTPSCQVILSITTSCLGHFVSHLPILLYPQLFSPIPRCRIGILSHFLLSPASRREASFLIITRCAVCRNPLSCFEISHPCGIAPCSPHTAVNRHPSCYRIGPGNIPFFVIAVCPKIAPCISA